MLDIKYIRENLDIVKKAAINKNREVDWEMLLKLDDKRRELIGKAEGLRAERNVNADREKGKQIKQNLKVLEEELREIEEKFTTLLLTVPNVPDKSVPVGKDSSSNKEVKR